LFGVRYDDGTKKTVARRDVEPMYMIGDVVKARQEKQHNRYWPAEIVEVRTSTQGIEALPGLCQARSHMTRPQVYRNGTYDIRPYPDGELRDMEYQIPCSSVRPARASGDAGPPGVAVWGGEPIKGPQIAVPGVPAADDVRVDTFATTLWVQDEDHARRSIVLQWPCAVGGV
jgi:hypothetical protein